MNKSDLSQYTSDFGLQNKLYRLVWNVSYLLLFRPFLGRLFKTWRNLVLRLFGAELHPSAHIYASVKIWSPRNLKLGAFSTLGPKVDCYNQGRISIGDHSIISQKSYLCASTHDFEQADFPLICKPIQIGDSVWVAADAFVGPGVELGDGVVVGARAAVFKSIAAWNVAGGNPAQVIKKRVIKDYE
ncbi:putative colanic acid biosynthesis acetyltransferase [Leeuwenhoekiella parthenopeia]|uniref:Colanic acid biosynthesis acetyltransferase n=1 Tax=Leeuwenhoekiella parthenopeia TaxID=2890320 RepID=A0ABS8GYS8_9FLAO|nr:putative colanic acid biosynthesis acetyltransferase [Leeuwenhoekiella parthenopeia]MCC4214246.1 putative colanic acid biosynthesis acetyltransferase [Leeuwenhoekiella parthenopeia]